MACRKSFTVGMAVGGEWFADHLLGVAGDEMPRLLLDH